MDWVSVCGRLLLAGVFLAAAVGKTADRKGTRQSLASFRVPSGLIAPVTWLLPAWELAVAVALVPPQSARVGAAGAAVLLTVFSGSIVAALLRGETPDCHCFGQIHSAPAGVGTLLRNAGLLAVAVAVAASGTAPSLDSWFGDRTAAELAAIALGGVVVAGCAYLVTLRRQRALGTDGAWRGGLPVGSQVPNVRFLQVDGSDLEASDVPAGQHGYVLVFVHPGCGPCRELLPEVSRWQRSLERVLPVHVVTTGLSDADRALAEEYALQSLLADPDRSVQQAFRVAVTPSAVHVDRRRAVAAPAVAGAPAIEELVRLAVNDGGS